VETNAVAYGKVGSWRSFYLRALLILPLAVSAPVFASHVRTLNLEEMTARADRIFHGRCIKIQVSTDPDLRQVVTYATFVPQSAAKGSVHGRLTIKMLGNQSASAQPGEAIEGLPRFQEGEEVVLFLYPDSAAGLTSPVGFGQGRFKVVHDKEGKALALNAFGNERILDGLTPEAQKKLGPQVERFRGRGGIPPDLLLDLVRSLD
jgi:hypothetical protein